MTRDELAEAYEAGRSSVLNELEDLKHKLEEERVATKHYESMWKGECEQADRSGKHYRDTIEKHRSMLQSMMTTVAEAHELVIDARFDETKTHESLSKAREKLRGIFSKEALDLVFPTVSTSATVMLGIGLLAVVTFLGFLHAKKTA